MLDTQNYENVDDPNFIFILHTYPTRLSTRLD